MPPGPGVRWRPIQAPFDSHNCRGEYEGQYESIKLIAKNERRQHGKTSVDLRDETLPFRGTR